MTPGYFRFATVAGSTLALVCEDDLWSVPRSGGVAQRLTASPGTIELPRLSPDGSQIAFVARDEGSPELYVMPAAGGPAKRLTFLGGDVCLLSGWSADGSELFFASDAGAAFVRETQGFRVAASGGHPEPLGLGHLRTLSVNAAGRVVLGRNNDDPARWKRYRGGTAGDLWVQREDGTFGRLIELNGNLVWPMWIGDRIAFVSDHEGVANLYSVDPDGNGLTRLTDETEYFVRFPSTDGASIVYTAGGDLRVLDLASGSVTTPSIDAPSTAPQTARRFIAASEDLEDFEPSPDGTSIVFVSRGRAFTMPLWEEAVVEHGEGSRVRQRCAAWLPDASRIVLVSDAGGRERIEIHQARREAEPVIAIDEDFGRVVELAASPVSDTIAVANHRYELLLIDLEDKSVRTIDKSPAAHIRDLAFSPDGRWLAYSCAPSAINESSSIIRIAKVKSGAVHDVTTQLRVDRSPAWDPEGKYLYFIGERDFNPVYDALQFDLSFPQASRPFAVALDEGVPSPFVPKAGPLHKERKHDEADERRKDDKPARVDIDFDGIEGRIIGFPVEEGQYGELVAARNRVYFTKFAVKGIKPGAHGWDDEDEGGSLIAYDFEQQRSATIANDVHDLRLGADGHTLVYSTGERLRAIDAQNDLPGEDDGPDSKDEADSTRRTGWLDLARASVEIEPRDEWAQMFYEAWRLQTEQFWDEAMSGVDWALARERYGKLLPRIRTRVELSDLLWELFGELGTSHAYEIGGDHRSPPQYRRGFLGADLQWDDSLGGYRVVRRYRGDSWDRDLDSPLAEPGQEVREGEAIVAINGRALTKESGPDEALVNAAGREVVLTVGAGKRDRRRVIVKTLRDERMLRYRAWVEDNRRLVHTRTNGTVGYVHIPDMGPWGFSEFHRGYLSEFNRDALIVDARFNRGGHVSPLLLEKLARKRVGYDVSRYGPPKPYPPESVGGPMVALTNQFAGSDGDIFSHCFKLYKLGPLVGKRTWGGVIGINPYHRLVDGTITTQPEYSFWFVDVGWKVENYGTDPDYDVDIAPHDASAGRDPQMEKALDLIAQMRAAHPNGKPHFEPRPNLGIPAAPAHAATNN
jgi:tricorn protease